MARFINDLDATMQRMLPRYSGTAKFVTRGKEQDLTQKWTTAQIQGGNGLFSSNAAKPPTLWSNDRS